MLGDVTPNEGVGLNEQSAGVQVLLLGLRGPPTPAMIGVVRLSGVLVAGILALAVPRLDLWPVLLESPRRRRWIWLTGILDPVHPLGNLLGYAASAGIT